MNREPSSQGELAMGEGALTTGRASKYIVRTGIDDNGLLQPQSYTVSLGEKINFISLKVPSTKLSGTFSSAIIDWLNRSRGRWPKKPGLQIKIGGNEIEINVNTINEISLASTKTI